MLIFELRWTLKFIDIQQQDYLNNKFNKFNLGWVVMTEYERRKRVVQSSFFVSILH